MALGQLFGDVATDLFLHLVFGERFAHPGGREREPFGQLDGFEKLNAPFVGELRPVGDRVGEGFHFADRPKRRGQAASTYSLE